MGSFKSLCKKMSGNNEEKREYKLLCSCCLYCLSFILVPSFFSFSLSHFCFGGRSVTQALLCNITWCSIIFLLAYKKKGGMRLGNKVFQIKITRENSELESRPQVSVYPSLCKLLSWYIWFKLTIYFWCPMYIWILCRKTFHIITWHCCKIKLIIN